MPSVIGKYCLLELAENERLLAYVEAISDGFVSLRTKEAFRTDQPGMPPVRRILLPHHVIKSVTPFVDMAGDTDDPSIYIGAAEADKLVAFARFRFPLGHRIPTADLPALGQMFACVTRLVIPNTPDPGTVPIDDPLPVEAYIVTGLRATWKLSEIGEPQLIEEYQIEPDTPALGIVGDSLGTSEKAADVS